MPKGRRTNRPSYSQPKGRRSWVIRWRETHTLPDGTTKRVAKKLSVATKEDAVKTADVIEIALDRHGFYSATDGSAARPNVPGLVVLAAARMKVKSAKVRSLASTEAQYGEYRRFFRSLAAVKGISVKELTAQDLTQATFSDARQHMLTSEGLAESTVYYA